MEIHEFWSGYAADSDLLQNGSRSMCAAFAKLVFSAKVPDFRRLASEPGFPVFDAANSNAKTVGRWLGRFAADPDCYKDRVEFHLRDASGSRIDAADCQPVSFEEIKRSLSTELASLQQQVDQVDPKGKAEQAIHRVLVEQLRILTASSQPVDPGAFFFKYHDRQGVWRLVWCWGFQRTDSSPAPAVVCASCRLLFISRPELAGRCPGCACELPVKRFPWKKALAAALATTLICSGVYGAWWFLQPRGRVDGLVISQIDDQPVVAEVRIAGSSVAMRTAINGSFRFDRLPAGRIRIEVIAPGFNPQTIEHELAAGQQSSVHIALVGDANVTGRVFNGASQLAISGAEVRIVDSSWKTLSDKNGDFQLKGVRSGTLKILATFPGFPRAELDLAVTSGETKDVSMQLTGDARLVGRVRSTDAAISDALVRLVGVGLETRTDHDGIFVFKQAPNGKVQFEVEADGFIRMEDEKELVSGQEQTVNILLTGAGRILGHVINGQDRRPLQDAEISISGTQLIFRTKEDGSFVLPGVPAGRITIQVVAAGFKMQKQQIDVETGKDFSIDVQMRGAAVLSGRVVDAATDKPVPFAEVAIIGTTLRKSTDSNGQFQFDDVPNLPLKGSITARGFATASFDANVGEGVEEELQLSLKGDAVLEGTVIDKATRLPVADARIAVVGTSHEAVSNGDGRFHIGGVRSGPAEIEVSAAGFAEQSLKRDLVSGKPTPLPIELAGDAVLDGTVIHLVTGKPVAGARVLLKGTQLTAQSNDDGRFRFENLRAGPVTVEVSAIGHRTRPTELRLDSAKPTDCRIELGGEAILTGTVVDATTDAPITGARVQIAGTSLRTRTDEKGVFNLTDAFGGPVELEYSAAGYEQGKLNKTLEPMGESEFELRLVGTGEAIGQVLDFEGRPVASARIKVVDTGHMTRSDAEGRFTFKKCPSGKVKFDVAAPGFEAVRIERELQENFKTDVKQIRLESNTNFSGHVINALNAAAVAGARLSIPQTDISSTTDGEGGFELKKVPVPKFTLRIDAEGYIADQVTVDPLSEHEGFDAVLSPVLQSGQARVALTWGGATPLDVHLITKLADSQSFHISRDQQEAVNAKLNGNVGRGHGPQTITITKLLPGRYRFFITIANGQPPSATLDKSIATLRLYRFDSKESQVFRAGNTDDARHRVWQPFTIDVDDAGKIKVITHTKNIYKDALPPD